MFRCNKRVREMNKDWNSRLGRKARGFLGEDEKGNVALMVTLALPVLILLAGGGADYARVLAARSKLQAAVDSAALAAYMHYAKNNSISTSKLRQYFDKHLRASLRSRFEQDIALGSEIMNLNRSTRELKVKVKAKFPTYFIRLVGIDSMDLNISSSVKASLNQTEVALVLDTTGSMEGAKLAELKKAATKFLNTIHAKLPGDRNTFKVAIVPFAQFVKVGKKYRNASWIKVDPDLILTKTVTEEDCPGYDRCVREEWQTWKDCWWEGNPDSANRHRVCKTKSGMRCVEWEWVPTGSCRNVTRTKKKKVKWLGCVGSRDYPLNLKDEKYGSAKIPGVMNRARKTSHPKTDYNGWSGWNKCSMSPLTPLMTLKDNKDTLISKIRSLNADGYTYIPVGLVWGWRVLSHKAPFTEGASDSEVKSKNVRKVIVLMTDGINTRSPSTKSNRLYRDHRGQDTSYANQLLSELCGNIKATNPATGRPNAEIITVTFDVSDPTIKGLLRQCSTLGSYDAKSGQLEKVFERIADDLVELHLTE